MTCKDNCLHYEVCLTAFSSKGMYLGDDAEEMECFKNKADVAEVVRCRDCKNFTYKCEEFLLDDAVGVCERSRTGFFDDGAEVYGNDFCSYGTPKERGGEK